ncbi:MAG: SRPBCC family protein [Aeromicrobium sp.]|uniref:SRPBCC family protein n=1 Tax=Aeromicrobium sp. TaxID=1871063 RepID=UPI0039E217F9
MAATFAVSRELTIAAPPERIAPLLADLRAWRQWSPWEEIDPDLQRTYSGAESGVGAEYHWKGNKKAGEGHMTVTGVDETSVEVRVDFLKPFTSTNQTRFDLTPTDGGTHVVWAMTGPRPLFMRLLSILMNPEKFIGPDLEKGLRQLGETASA